MKRSQLLLISASICVTGVTSAATNFLGGDSSLAANWDNGLPGAGNDGTISVSGDGPGGAQNTATFAGSTITVNNGAVLTFGADLSAGTTNWIVNDATINAGDDIFTNNSIITFNAGSITSVNDDFEAQSALGGILNLNGGTHSVGDYFGFQGGTNNNGTLNFLGGTVTAARLRFDGGANGSNGTIGGSATFIGTGTTNIIDLDGTVNILSSWTGSLTAANFMGSDWETVVTNGWTFESSTIDSTLFGDNFVVSNGGQTLALIPEPSTSLLALGCGALLLRRRRHS